MGKWTRRAFITAGSLVGGGLVLGVGGIAFAPNRFGMVPEEESGETSVTTWIKITPQNEIIALIPHCEMGQGVQTGLAMLLAEELEADWQHVRVEEAPAENLYANGHLIAGMIAEMVEVPNWLERSLQYASYKVTDIVGLQVTGGSMSTRTTGLHGMKIAGAAAKAMLLEAAAQRWNVSVEELTAKNSQVIHTGSGQHVSFAELADAAANIAPPVHPVFKDPKDYTLVGTQQTRSDIPSKVNGSAEYGVDISLPDMLYASVNSAPVHGAILTSVDANSIAEAKNMPGVKEVVQLSNAVAVIAEGYWQASQAIQLLKAEYSVPEQFVASTEELYQQHSEVLNRNEGKHESKTGEGASILENAEELIEREYRVPYLAHATMEPMAATAIVTPETCEVWAGTQDPLSARGSAAKAAGLKSDQVTFHNLHSGGGFGRRLPGSFDYVEQAVEIAKAVSPLPVKLIWSREEDMQHDYYRIATQARFRGSLQKGGLADCWACDYTAPSEMGAAIPPYEIPHQEIKTHETPGHLRVGSWRSVASSQQGFFLESFADELATAAGKDPYEYRLSMLTGKPRHTAVLEKVANMSEWNAPLPEGHGKGIALVEAFGTIMAQVAEVSVLNGHLTVHNIWAAVDCGLVVNPDQAESQVQGGIIFGLSAALFHEIKLQDGAVKTRSFPDYPMVQLHNAPAIKIEFLRSAAKMGGLGEPGVPPVAPAVANAIYAATGERKRTLPLWG